MKVNKGFYKAMEMLEIGEVPLPGIYHNLVFNYSGSRNIKADEVMRSHILNNPKIFIKQYRKLRRLRYRNYYGVYVDRSQILFCLEILREWYFRKYSYENLRYKFHLMRKQVFNQLIKVCDLCIMCSSNEDLTVDHIKPLIKGGTNHMSNFQILCRKCNSSKGSKI